MLWLLRVGETWPEPDASDSTSFFLIWSSWIFFGLWKASVALILYLMRLMVSSKLLVPFLSRLIWGLRIAPPDLLT